MSPIPVPLDEAVEFTTVSLPLFSERIGQALTRVAVKELVTRAKTANVTANGNVDLATDIAGPRDFAAASKMLAMYELYSRTRLDYATKAWVGNADAKMDPVVKSTVQAACEAVNTGPPEETIASPKGGDNRPREAKRNEHLRLSSAASKIVRRRTDLGGAYKASILDAAAQSVGPAISVARSTIPLAVTFAVLARVTNSFTAALVSACPMRSLKSGRETVANSTASSNGTGIRLMVVSCYGNTERGAQQKPKGLHGGHDTQSIFAAFSGVPNKGEQNQMWQPHPCLLRGPTGGGNATSALHSQASPTKGNKITSGYLTLAFSRGQKGAELLRHPRNLGGPQRRET